MTLEQYRKEIGNHLQMIEAGAEMSARHARLMTQKPGFETKAQDELDRAERVLQSALSKIRAAKTTYAGKQTEAA